MCAYRDKASPLPIPTKSKYTILGFPSPGLCLACDLAMLNSPANPNKTIPSFRVIIAIRVTLDITMATNFISMFKETFFLLPDSAFGMEFAID